MTEMLETYAAVPRLPVALAAHNTAPSLEGRLRKQWASCPGRGPGWRAGLVAGNGTSGLVHAGAPEDEVLIYQNIDFVIPTFHPRYTPPEVGAQLEDVRRHILANDPEWMPPGHTRTTVYPFHPGLQLRVNEDFGPVTEYRRGTDLTRGELLVNIGTASGNRAERHFVSRAHDAIISEFSYAGRGSGLTMSPDLPEEMEGYGWWMHGTAPETQMKYRVFADEAGRCIGLIAHYPEFDGSELRHAGYLTLCRVLADGGAVTADREKIQAPGLLTGERPVIRVQGARRVCVIARAVPIDDMGSLEEFCITGGAELISREAEKLDAVAALYTKDGVFDYDAAADAHRRRFSEMMGRQRLSLGGGEEHNASLRELLARQKRETALIPELVERVYAIGRYALISCAGHSAPRLCGMWTGEWNPAWSGAYTMDANVNIQMSGVNLADLPEALEGYCRFVARQLPDWEENAKRVYGINDAVLVPVNTDGRRAALTEFDAEYPFEYWNAGAGWLAVPLFEGWQCFGDIPLGNGTLRDSLLIPLLKKILNFWSGYCTEEYYTDAQGRAHHTPGKTSLARGEHFLLVPGYSPENTPAGQKHALAANTAMDIAAARGCVRMARELLADDPEAMARCARLASGLPEYLTDASGALKEWALSEFAENNAHRHLSHLYCAWPEYETHHDARLADAALRAVRNRDRENLGKDDTPSHGIIHKALITARLGQGSAAGALIRQLLASDLFYDTGMTDHNTDRCRAVFCTDTLFGLQGVIQEMLVYSDAHRIELLPAPDPAWTEGCLRGMRTRCGAWIEELRWDSAEVRLTLRTDAPALPRITCRGAAPRRTERTGDGAYLCIWEAPR